MTGAAIPGFEALIFTSRERHELVELGRLGAARLWDEQGPLHSIIVGNDLIAEGVAHFARERGLRFLHDFSLVSLAETPFPPYGTQEFSSSRMPFAECGRALADLVVDQIEAEEDWAWRRWLFHPYQVTRHDPKGEHRPKGEREIVRQEFLIGTFANPKRKPADGQAVDHEMAQP